ncbi:amidohydrolase [Bacillus timonensis]|uniref:amidohydrolase n=1 Tax=Bacillus timonensis TaxID=1033734 RepID=UPI0011DC772A|nr:amidohydrolase [Bacillus timonensis]
MFLLFGSLLTGVASAKNVLTPKTKKEQVDLILKNGFIYTVDENRSIAKTVAVRDGEIVFVGDNNSAMSLKGPETEVIDLKGKMVLPGFIDSHNHAYLKSEELFWVTLPGVSADDPEDAYKKYKEAIEAYVQKNPGIQQVRGVGLNEIAVNAIAEQKGITPKEVLDGIVPDVPAVIITHGHHDIWVNSIALKNANIDSTTENPAGGTIVRIPGTSEPNGILREFSAQNLIINALPQTDFTVEEYKTSILAFQEMAAERGTTSVFVPVHYPTESLLQAFEELDNANKLTVRYDLGLWADETKGTKQIQTFIDMRNKYQGNLYKVDSVKIFADGTSYLVWEQDVLKETVAALDKEGFRVFIHAIGNNETFPVSPMLDAFEYAAKVNGVRDSRHAITHIPWVFEEDIDRFKDLNVIPIPQPAWFSRTRDARPDQYENLNRLKSYFDAGLPVASSSDYPVNDFWPLDGVEVGMTRIGVNETDLSKAAWPQERATLDQMLASYTVNGAHAIFAEDETGTIEVGIKADFVILEKNLFEVPVTEISDVKILRTIFAGKTVYNNPASK